jgi:hypothetical protein
VILFRFFYQITGDFDHYVRPGVHLVEGGRNLYLDHLTTNNQWQEKKLQIGRRLEHFEVSNIILYCNWINYCIN